MKHLLSSCRLLFVIIGSSIVVGCGESTDTDPAKKGDGISDTVAADTTERGVAITPSDYSGDMSEEESAFLEEVIARQHGHLMAQVPKGSIDSLMQIHLLGASDPRAGRRVAEKELVKLMRRQDTLVRQALVEEFDRPLDSINAILGRQGVERP